MDAWNTFVGKSTIHGISDWASTKSKKDKLFWTVVLLIAASFVPYSIISLIRDFNDYPIMTFIDWKDQNEYEFPLIRFCPMNWINSSRVSEMNLSTNALIYALSLLYNVKLNVHPNAMKAKQELKAFMKERNMTDYKQVYSSITYDIDKVISCEFCKENSPRLSYTVVGICYDMVYPLYHMTDMADQNHEYGFIYHIPMENQSDPSNLNNIYSSTYLAHILYLAVDENDFFGYDPILLKPPTKYTVVIKSWITKRLPNSGQRKCLDREALLSEGKAMSYEMCQTNKREHVLGPSCWHYKRYGLSSFDETDKTGYRLPEYSSLTHHQFHDETKDIYVETCENSKADELMKQMNSCRSVCQRWKFDFVVRESSGYLFFGSKDGSSVTEAQWFSSYRQELANNKFHNDSDPSVLEVSFRYAAREGVKQYEEVNRGDVSTFISNVGGWMGLMAGASALSICQVIELFIKLFPKCRQRMEASYTL